MIDRLLRRLLGERRHVSSRRAPDSQADYHFAANARVALSGGEWRRHRGDAWQS